ncbi:hypothetical protein Taro_028743, partial [Colocasia esculenta]|nr:hypothetical protein [Colocasia esculenta]
MSGLSDTQDSEVEQNVQKRSHPSKETDGKLEPWKEEDEKDQCDDDEEEEDVDFNPFLIAESASEASSSLSSEDEGSADTYQGRPLHRSEHQEGDAATRQTSGTRNSSRASKSKHRKVFHSGFIQEGPGEKNIVMGKLDKKQPQDVDTEQGEGFVSPDGSRKGNFSGYETEAADDTTKDGSLEQTTLSSPSPKSSLKSAVSVNNEDAICTRTRARHSLADYTLEELEVFLQESDDDDDLQNVDDEEEYRKFLAAVLSGGNDDGQEKDEDGNLDEDEENDADFEIEIEEALESDIDENIQGNQSGQEKHGGDVHGPETRKKRFQRSSTRNKKKLMGQAKTQLRPLLPCVANNPVDPVFLSHGWHSPCPKIIPNSSSKADLIYGFTAQQIGQLFSLIHEHVQLLIQVLSLSVHDPARQHIGSKVQMLILEMVDKREEALAWRKVPYPVYCFDHLHFYQSLYFDPSQRVSSSWAPSISTRVLTTLDVDALGLAKKYIADVSATMLRYKRSQMEGSHTKSHLKREPIFPLHNSAVPQETSAEASGNNALTSSSILPSHMQPKKSLAATLVERTKRQSVALVPSDIASLAQAFQPLFNPALFPHKPPPPPVANRVLFTDSEDGLLAMGLMEYNNDWAAIQQRFLPCKSKHQIFVRQKNRSSSKAPENPIKAVRRMKTSPLTADEKALIAEGLKLLKHEWISVWKLFVPHRDPSLLPRQWRIATGTQKSYKKDETVNEKRRLYEAKRRKLKASMTDWQMLPDYEVDDVGQSVDDNMDIEDEAYVHEAFLADVEPANSKQNSSELQCSGINKRHLPSADISPHKDHVSEDVSAVIGEHIRSARINMPVHETFNSSKLPADIQQLHSTANMPIGTSSTVSSNWLPLNSMPCISKVSSTYRMRKKKGAQVVKLAPELPPVNLPPSVRVISQSAFRNYHGLSSSSIDKGSVSILVPRLPHTSNARAIRINPGSCETGSHGNGIKDNPGMDLRASAGRHATEESNSESDIQMHPLLFQISDTEHPPYYTRNCSSAVSRSLDFFAAGHQQFNLKVLPSEKSGDMRRSSFPVLQSREAHFGKLTIDFHPLLQKSNEVNCSPALSCQDRHLLGESEPDRGNSIQFLSPPDSRFLVPQQMDKGQSVSSYIGQYEKDNELDLDIHLYSATNNVKATGGSEVVGSEIIGSSSVSKLGAQMEEKRKQAITSSSSGHNVRDDGAPIAANSSIRMEKTSRVHYQSRTAIDSFGTSLSSSGVFQHEEGNTGDQPSPEIVMEQEELSDSDEEADNVEFECEEMDDSDGEELDGEQPDNIQNK